MVKSRTAAVAPPKIAKQKALPSTKTAKPKASRKRASKPIQQFDESSDEEHHGHSHRLSSAAFQLNASPYVPSEFAIQRQLDRMVAAMRESIYQDVYQAVKEDVLTAVESHIQEMREEIAQQNKKSVADTDALKAATTVMDTNLNTLSASLARYKSQFKVFKKEASNAIVKLANECSQRDLSTIPFTTSKEQESTLAALGSNQPQLNNHQWKQVNDHVEALHKDHQRQFRTLEEQLVQLVEHNNDFHSHNDVLPVVRDELTSCVSQCNQLQHELVQLVNRVDSQEWTIRRLSANDQRLERSMQGALHEHFSDLEEIGTGQSKLGQRHPREETNSAVAEQIADIRQRLQTLSTTTVNACKSLSSGLKDVQKAIIGFYRWADAVYDGMDSLCQALELENPIPRLKLHADKKQDR